MTFQLGTIFISDNEDFVVDIVPVKDNSESISIKNRKYKKRSIGENSIYHIVNKRSLSSSSDFYSTKTIDIKDDLKDYLILPSNENFT